MNTSSHTDRAIRVYAVNLPARTERRVSIEEQFAGRTEFELHVVDGIEHRNGPFGLWQTFYGIVEREAAVGSDYFIFCEDDHVFTPDYSPSVLRQRIADADRLGADLLSGGMSVARTPVEAAPGLFWVSWFNGMQFTVIFNRCYGKILAAHTSDGYAVDIQLSYLAKRKFVMWPYISVQREFGYSDATSVNDEDGRVTRFFDKSRALLATLHKVRGHYRVLPASVVESIMRADVGNSFITAHVINLPERADRRNHIQTQFENRPEFRLEIVEASRHEVGAVGLWQSICRIVRSARDAGEEFVLICEDDHIFTCAYSRDMFMRRVMLAGAMGAQLLSGGVGDFSNLVPLPGGLGWIDRFWCTQFMVIYRSAFDIILRAPFGIRDVADDKLSAILTAKMVCVPFISEQTDFGYSDITASNNRTGTILRHFDNSRRRLRHYLEAFSSEPTTSVSPAEYLARPGLKALQLGCGDNLLEGWLNTDVAPGYGVTFMDAAQPFPLPDGCMDCVFAEHLAEGMTPSVLGRMLSECRRVLRSGGIVRLTFYSADCLAAILAPCSDADDYIRANTAIFSLDAAGSATGSVATAKVMVANNYIRKMGEAVLHTFEELRDLLMAAGFDGASITLCNPVAGKLAGTNRHRHYLPERVYAFETVTVEATRS